MQSKNKLGEILLTNNLITNENLDNAIEYSLENSTKLGEALCKLGFIKENEMLEALSSQLGLEYIDVLNYDLDQKLTEQLPEDIARKNNVIILSFKNNCYTLGFADPLDLEAYDEVAHHLKGRVIQAIVKQSDLLETFDRVYISKQEIYSFVEEASSVINKTSDVFADIKGNIDASSAPVIKLLNSLLTDALKARASDIHLEPALDKFRIRLRIDGDLKEIIINDVRISSVLIQILKLKARMNISETRIPQDGRFNLQVYHHKVDVRLSTVPTVHGESAVLRLLDQSKAIGELASLGMKPAMIDAIYQLLTIEHGMLLVTGPTGSGKTTTLYSILQKLNNFNKKIITVEDPVEYTIDRVNQIQVDYAIDLDFTTILKSVLRQDPDIIMVGEIRDRETAIIAMRAAITGHLVLATLHTNDALTSAIRLVDIGQEGYMVASALKAILSQRLIKLNCDKCTQPHDLQTSELEWLSKYKQIPSSDYVKFKKGTGCYKCHDTGYYGRTAIYELLELNNDMLDALRCDSLTDFVSAARKSEKYTALLSEAFILATSGKVNINELMRLYGELDEQQEYSKYTK